VTISGTPGPYSFSWTGPNGFTSTNQNIATLEPGDYEITITDTNLGCSDTYTLNVPDNVPAIMVTPNITPNSNCNPPFNGAIDIAVAGTPGPYSFSWTGPGGFVSALED